MPLHPRAEDDEEESWYDSLPSTASFCSEGSTKCPITISLSIVAGLVFVGLVLFWIWRRRRIAKKRLESERRALDLKLYGEKVFKGFEDEARGRWAELLRAKEKE
ncbi:hypothetical protein I302_106001 [Kwoniella bestiolae CBS 10118]|uniref:Uncharacterized protein n=1 Tax=Kwoniella bestiolae CBS 10118 TaxID=1296100 RepID=A0A1B9G2T0_9TREE|nr:hypothetical protein I302_05125 [Kwoniella bestiolae CBS 10118]OCF25311.1 hypothetical protein I302_05125 [Kwoniella bestiolae CBS 10118]